METRPAPNTAHIQCHQGFIPPQLATFSAHPPSEADWLFERKYDGHRLQVHLDTGRVSCFSRNGHDITDKLGSLLPGFHQLEPAHTVLDGELCAWSDDDTTDLGQLNATIHHGGPFRFFAFDLLKLAGEDLCNMPLLERKTLLAALLASRSVGSPVRAVPFQLSHGSDLFEEMRTDGHEGIIAKRLTSRYHPGHRSSSWRKIKVTQKRAFKVAGWECDAANTFVKSLVLAEEVERQLTYCGRVGSGFSLAQRFSMHAQFQAIETRDPPLGKSALGLSKLVRWCRPTQRALVSFADISHRGILRSPSFVQWCEEASPRTS